MNKKCKSKPKSWRHFQKFSRPGNTIRKFCYAFLILETALLIRKFGISIAHIEEHSNHQLIPTEKLLMETQETYKESSQEVHGEEIQAENPSEKENSLPSAILEHYFGIHFRMKEGVIEFYHKEERQNFY